MEKKDLVEVTEEMLSGNSIIAAVNSSVEEIKAIETKIAKAVDSANNAKKKAKDANEVERHWYQNTTARIVDKLQPAVKSLAKAVSESADTQKLLFEHQKILAQACQRLFAMGVSNIAATRMVIRNIKLQLENASEEEISELARQELMNVMKQLQAQEDLANRQEKMSEKIKVHSSSLREHDKLLEDHDVLLQSQEGKIDKLKTSIRDAKKNLQSKNLEQDERITKNDAKDQEQDKRLAEKDAKDLEHDKRLDEKDEIDQEHDKRLDEKDAKDQEHDKRLDEKDEKDNEHDTRIAENRQLIESIQETLKNLLAENKQFQARYTKEKRVLIALSMVAIVISIVSFFV